MSRMLQVPTTIANTAQVPNHTSTSKSSSPVRVKSELATNSISPIRLKSRNAVTKTLNFKISFDQNEKSERRVQVIELSRNATQVPKVKPGNLKDKVARRKQWPKLVCSMEIAALTTNDSILNAATLSRKVDFLSSPPKSPRIPITAPGPSTSPRPLLQSPTFNLPQINSSSPTKIYSITQASSSTEFSFSQPSVSPQKDTDTFLEPKKRRLVLTDSLPPMFKAPFKMTLPNEDRFKVPRDLRRKISGNLRKFEDDTVSICAHSEMAADDETSVVENSTASKISPAKKAGILNWLTSSANSSDSSNTPGFSSDSDSHCSPEKADSPEDTIANNSNSNESRTSHNRFDRFEVSFCKSDANLEVGGTQSQDDANQSFTATTKPNQMIIKSNRVEGSPRSNVVSSPSIIHPWNSSRPENLNSSLISKNRMERSPSFDRMSSNTSKDSLSHEIKRSVSLSNMSIEELEPETIQASVSMIHTTPTEHTSPFKRPQKNNVPFVQKVNFRGSPVAATPGSQHHQVDQRISMNSNTNERSFRSDVSSPIHQNAPPNQNHRGSQIPHRNINPNIPPLLGPPPQHPNRGPRSNFPSTGTFNGQFSGPRMRPPNPSNQNANQGGWYVRMNSMIPQTRTNSTNFAGFDPTRPPPRHVQQANTNDFQRVTSPQRNQQEFVRPEPQLALMNLNQINDYLAKACAHYYKGHCKFGQRCHYHHECSVLLRKSMAALNIRDLKGIFKQLCHENKHLILPELLDIFVQSYEFHKDKLALLALLRPILLCPSCIENIHKILNALCQFNMTFKDAVLKAFNYVGGSNRKSFDVFFSIATEQFDPTASSPHQSGWSLIEQLLDFASHIDFGVFADLCVKCVRIPPYHSKAVMTVLGQLLLEKVEKVESIDQSVLTNLCNRMEMTGCGHIAAEVRKKFIVVEGNPWQRGLNSAANSDEIMETDDMFAAMSDISDDHQLPAISSTISGPNNQFFNSASLQISNASAVARITTQSTARNAERTKNSCSPDSSSFAPFNTKPIRSSSSTPTAPSHTSRHHSSLSRSIQVPLNQSITTTPPQSTTTSAPFTNTTYDLDPDLLELCHSITRSQFHNAAQFIAREKEEAINVICKLVHGGSVPVQVAFSFFDILWDHPTENFVQFVESKGIVLRILFNIYEFLLKENNKSDASYLLNCRFSKDRHTFLHFKTFLPSGQCSPMLKCHKAVKILLEEKMLDECFEWFKLEEYEKVMLTTDSNNQALAEEKDHLIEEFLQLSYRKLDVAFNLVEYCMSHNLSANIDFRKHYNWILIQMINNIDHKEQVILIKDRLFNDEYVYLSSQTLRSYLVEFYSRLSLEELLHIYDVISRDGTYPIIKGDEHLLTLQDTLKESELTIILLQFLHQVVKKNRTITWDVSIRFCASSTTIPTMQGTRSGAIYPRNLLMYSTVNDAIKRLISVLRSSNCVESNSTDVKWRVCIGTGTVTLLEDHVVAMVRNYKGTRTFT